jgi:hypothetical protein
MLVIRREQMQALADRAKRDFVASMVLHLHGFAPRHSAVVGDAALRDAIELGCWRCAEYGLKSRGAVRFWVEAMFLFGSDFDRDPQWHWVAPALADRSGDELARADRLHRAAMHCLATVAGADRRDAWRALRAIRGLPLQALPADDATFEPRAFELLRHVHPAKVAWMGEERVLGLLRRARESAASLGLGGDRAAAVCAGASFALGTGFANDPLLPWIRRTIVHPLIASPALRTQRLHARLMTYLDAVLENAAPGGTA